MNATLLGFVERLNATGSGPGARLKPLYQSSADKAWWLTPEEEFPNSGVVSWWKPIPEARAHTAWTFQINISPTYEHDVLHHDYWSVRGNPAPAVELIDLENATDPEEIRMLLVEEGLPLERCATRRLVIRDRSGLMVGPLDLSLRDGRLFLDEKHFEALIPTKLLSGELFLASWGGHQFLPQLFPTRPAGEADFSPNTVFFKRVLKHLKEITPNALGNVKMTDRLITSYCAAVENKSLSPLEKQRLKRLHGLAASTSADRLLLQGAVADLLGMPVVKELIATATEAAVETAMAQRNKELADLERNRIELGDEVKRHTAQLRAVREQTKSLEAEHARVLSAFEERVRAKFDDVARDASTFLAESVFLRAALSPSLSAVNPPPSDHFPTASTTSRKELSSDALVTELRTRFEQAGVQCAVPIELLSSWASGFIPITYGASARDGFEITEAALFGGGTYFLPLGPTLTAPTELLRLTVASASASGSLEGLLSTAIDSEELFLLVFDNLNLCQIDSVLMPLLRSHATFRGGTSSRTQKIYATPAGTWPANLLLAGILSDTALGLPMSKDIWSCATFIDTDTERICESLKKTEPPGLYEPSRVQYGTWATWLDGMKEESSDALLLSTHVSRRVRLSGVFKRLVRSYAMAIDNCGSHLSEDNRSSFVTESLLIPYLISRGLDPSDIINDPQKGISVDADAVARVNNLLRTWGIDLP